MIRFVTYRNFPLLDLQIEEAYRRRCDASAFAVLADIEDVAIPGKRREERCRSKRSRDWVRQLALELYALSKAGRGAPRAPSPGLVAATRRTEASSPERSGVRDA